MESRQILLPLASVMEKRDYGEQPRITVSNKDLSQDGRELLVSLDDHTVSLSGSGPR